MATETNTPSKPKRIVYYTIPVELPEMPDFDSLPDEDGENLDSDWHRLAMNLLIELVYWLYQGRSDYYVGGNMFIYYTAEQFEGLRIRGPDFFFVKGVNREPIRRKWIVMKEGGKYPNTIIELLSSTTADQDLTTKKDIYEQIFRTPDYFCYDPDTHELKGWHLGNGNYEAITSNERGWLWCEELQVWVGTWKGKHPTTDRDDVWLRFYTKEGELVPTFAEAQKSRADRAEAEAERLRTLLSEKESTSRFNGGQQPS